MQIVRYSLLAYGMAEWRPNGGMVEWQEWLNSKNGGRMAEWQEWRNGGMAYGMAEWSNGGMVE